MTLEGGRKWWDTCLRQPWHIHIAILILLITSLCPLFTSLQGDRDDAQLSVNTLCLSMFRSDIRAVAACFETRFHPTKYFSINRRPSVQPTRASRKLRIVPVRPLVILRRMRGNTMS